MKILLFATLALAAMAPAAEVSSDDFYQAIRTNDLTRLRTLIAKGNVNSKDRRGATPLMYAAAVGSADAMKALLAAGADAKAKNSLNATALIWGATDLEKVRLLVGAGADVNARSKQGMTPLLVAASTAGSIEIVRLLLAKGADVKALDGAGGSALLLAAFANDLDTVRLFIASGLDVNAATHSGDTVLHAASINLNIPMVKLLLDKGAKVDVATTEGVPVRKGPVALNHLTALMLAAPYANPELLRILVDAGANVNARDIRNMTPLMLAVASEEQNPEAVRFLLQKGADVNAKSDVGETALDWAKKFGSPQVIRLVQDAGGKASGQATGTAPTAPSTPNLTARAAIEKSVALLQSSSTEFFKESGCVGCHHQNFTALAVASARAKGVHVDDAAAAEHLKVLKTQWTGAQEAMLQRLDPPGGADTLSYSLLGLAAVDYPPDAITDAMAVNVAGEQLPNGGWLCGGNSRSPLQESCIAQAARAIRALQLYGPPGLKAKLDERIARARGFLLKAHPKTTDDASMMLLGLKWSAAAPDKTKESARKLLELQREDGGWSGNQWLESDAFATGEALNALHEAGALKPSEAAYKRATNFLLKTQRQDGSWYVKSRAVKFQPYFQSGFPHDHDQWISATGTAVASVALANTITPPAQRAAK